MINIVIFGNGAREHTIIEKLLENSSITTIYTIDNNDFIISDRINTSLNSLDDILEFSKTNSVNMVIFGPEKHLVEGYVDILEAHNIKCFGPNKYAANIEGSKIFSKSIMDKFNIPTSEYIVFKKNYNTVCNYIENSHIDKYVIKLSGLASGKGVFLPDTKDEALKIINNIYVNHSYGNNQDIIIEERLYGEEVSVMGFCNGNEIFLLPQSQDYKRLHDNNNGPNTGGMGSYAPAHILNTNELQELKHYMDLIVKDLNYVGILYAGVMRTNTSKNSQFKLLEFNCRFGDPECQVLLNLLENDLYTTMLQCISKEKLDLRFKNEYCSNIVLSHLDYPYKKANDYFKLNLDYTQNIIHKYNIKLYSSNIKNINNTYCSNGGRIMSIVSTNKILFKSINNCYNFIKHINYDNMYYRKDIGLLKCLEHNTNYYNENNGKNIAVLSSGTGNSCKKLLENIVNKQLNSTISVIITNRSDAQIINLAKNYKISYIYLPKKKNISNNDYDIQLLTILKSYNVDIIFLIGYMKIITPLLINSYKNKIFNIHPSLLPKYSGLMDLDIHQNVIKNNDKYTGCTLHLVEEQVDEGQIILQKQIKVFTIDKYELKHIIQNLENDCIVECVQLIENGSINNKLSYNDCGVNINKGNMFVNMIKNILTDSNINNTNTNNKNTNNTNTNNTNTNNKNIDNIGKFCSIYNYKDIKLAACTDGVGSKLELAKMCNNYSTIGIDLVAMCVNDLVVHGARPLFMLDYIAVSELDLNVHSEVVKGIHTGCKISNCELVGGETAELPSLFYPTKYDLGGFSVGVIENDIYPKNICEGDIILGLYSNGVHSNGYSLILNLLKHYSYDLEDLLKPTTIYVNTILELINNYECIKGFAHITGGGLMENIPRILPKDLSFTLDKKWNMENVFHWIKKCSQCNQDEMLTTFNCNIGMVVIVSKDFDINMKKKYNMIEIGSIIKSNIPVINVDLFNN